MIIILLQFLFGLNGKRIFQTDHDKVVEQYSLNNPYDISSSTKDGSINHSRFRFKASLKREH